MLAGWLFGWIDGWIIGLIANKMSLSMFDKSN